MIWRPALTPEQQQPEREPASGRYRQRPGEHPGQDFASLALSDRSIAEGRDEEDRSHGYARGCKREHHIRHTRCRLGRPDGRVVAATCPPTCPCHLVLSNLHVLLERQLERHFGVAQRHHRTNRGKEAQRWFVAFRQPSPDALVAALAGELEDSVGEVGREAPAAMVR